MAAAALGEASDTMMAHPLALQLRNLQTLVELGVEKNTTIVFPAPLMSGSVNWAHSSPEKLRPPRLRPDRSPPRMGTTRQHNPGNCPRTAWFPDST